MPDASEASQMILLKSLKVLVKGDLLGSRVPPKVAGTRVSVQMLKEGLQGFEGVLNTALQQMQRWRGGGQAVSSAE
jgi:hypothetical protein